jgi:glycosidase
MQWNTDRGMGFTSPGTQPWLPFSDTVRSVEAQIDDADSSLSLYRALLALRREAPALLIGGMTMLDPDNECVLAYSRHLGNSAIFVTINFTDETQSFEFPHEVRQILSTHTDRSGPFTRTTLSADEALVAR